MYALPTRQAGKFNPKEPFAIFSLLQNPAEGSSVRGKAILVAHHGEARMVVGYSERTTTAINNTFSLCVSPDPTSRWNNCGMEASFDIFLPRTTAPTSSVYDHLMNVSAMVKPSIMKSKIRATKMPIKWHRRPFSSLTGPNEVVFYCCCCGNGPWRYGGYSHCQVCQHPRCRQCRFQTVRSRMTGRSIGKA
jgi:hypothetical protein